MKVLNAFHCIKRKPARRDPDHVRAVRVSRSMNPTAGPGVNRVHGDVDVVTAPILRACVAEALLTGHSVVVDLLRVPFIGYAGLAALDDAAARLSEQRCRLTVAAPARLHSTLDWIGISAAVRCFDTVAEAFHAALAHPATTADREPTFPILE
jgi:anti-anti-sigma factor